MNPYVIKTPTARGLTKAGERAFVELYDALTVQALTHPVIAFNASAMAAIHVFAALRSRDWASTSRWDAKADVTGLLGELAVSKCLGLPAEVALKNFVEGLHGSDNGFDLTCGGETVDVKASRSGGLKFKFSKRNPNRHKASIISFVQVLEVGGEGIAKCLGWAWKFRLRPYLRSNGERFEVMRFETAYREGVISPINQLLLMNREER